MTEIDKKFNIDEDLQQILDAIGKRHASEVDKSIHLKKDQGTETQKRPLSPFFYKVSNHHELYRVGTSFLHDFNKGIKSFAISSVGYQTSQQRTILGLASFFDHQQKLKICILSDNLYLGAFKEIMQASLPREVQLKESKSPVLVHGFYGHFDFIDINALIDIGRDLGVNFRELLDELLEQFDIIFWDVPELHRIQSEREQFFPLVMRFESLSIIVAKGQTERGKLEEVRSFFMGYGINLKGVLFDTQSAGNACNALEIKKRAWWKRWFT